jgi:hypothetical protein
MARPSFGCTHKDNVCIRKFIKVGALFILYFLIKNLYNHTINQYVYKACCGPQEHPDSIDIWDPRASGLLLLPWPLLFFLCLSPPPYAWPPFSIQAICKDLIKPSPGTWTISLSPRLRGLNRILISPCRWLGAEMRLAVPLKPSPPPPCSRHRH